MPLKVKIIDPDNIIYEGEADFIVAPSKRGDLGIFPGHTGMFAELLKGDIILSKDKKDEKFALESGILKVLRDEVLILMEPEVKEGEALK